ncbi:hypothetical protein M3Y97_00777300 [Aphelenchoides bicaudatus]|nr:hypothetical protein M3Y97_00777300 [Aphelenchoides bicaudatus]
MSHYNRSLDEILGLNTAAKPLDTAPIAPPRRLGSRSSENNSSLTPQKTDRRQETKFNYRHGRSSQSESSSSSKLENTVTVERKPGILNNRNTDVWNREEETHETEVTTLSNGPRRSSNLNRSIQQPSTILEQKRLSSLSSSSPSSGSSFRDEFLVEPRPEQLESNTQPFELTTSSSSQSEDSSSDLSNASQRTYSTKVNENNDSLLNAPIKLAKFSFISRKSK